MSQPLTFANYSPLEHGSKGIFIIGATTDTTLGVVQEMAQAFGHELSVAPDVDNLGKLIGQVGPAKELQDNIRRVQDVLGTDKDAGGIARNWAERSGLLLPVERSFAGGDTSPKIQYELAIITGGVRNWINRRVEIALTQTPSQNVWLVAGNRLMKSTEGPDVEEGMIESDYMREIVLPKLVGQGLVAKLVEVASESGDEVMAVGAEQIADRVKLDDKKVSVITISNAGAWVQNAGQLRRALRNLHPGFDANGRQFSVVSDTFPLGTGSEPPRTHQNPFSALGQIARNAQELARHL